MSNLKFEVAGRSMDLDFIQFRNYMFEGQSMSLILVTLDVGVIAVPSFAIDGLGRLFHWSTVR